MDLRGNHLCPTEIWSSQDSLDTKSRALCAGLERLRTNAPEVLMPPGSIVERCNVFRQLSLRVLTVLEDSLLDPFLIQTGEEGFRDSVIPTIAPSAHARLQTIGLAKASPVITPILAALIGVDYGVFGMSATNRHHDRIQYEFSMKRLGSSPADDEPRVQIHYYSKV